MTDVTILVEDDLEHRVFHLEEKGADFAICFLFMLSAIFLMGQSYVFFSNPKLCRYPYKLSAYASLCDSIMYCQMAVQYLIINKNTAYFIKKYNLYLFNNCFVGKWLIENDYTTFDFMSFDIYFFGCVFIRDTMILITTALNIAYLFEIYKTVKIPFKPQEKFNNHYRCSILFVYIIAAILVVLKIDCILWIIKTHETDDLQEKIFLVIFILTVLVLSIPFLYSLSLIKKLSIKRTHDDLGKIIVRHVIVISIIYVIIVTCNLFYQFNEYVLIVVPDDESDS